MLRKNNLDRVRQGERCTVSCQTQQFLLYLAMEQKLENVYHEYRTLQKKYEEANRLIEFLQYKNTYLETSLFEISVTYNNKMANSNIRRIEEIRNLEERISKEAKELENIHQLSLAPPSSQNTFNSVIQEENRRSEPTKMAVSKASSSNTIKEKSVQEQPSSIKYRKISLAQQSHVRQEKQQTSLQQSKNEFLPEETQPIVLGERKQRVNCEADQYEDQHKNMHNEQPSTYRRSGDSKCKKSSTKKKKNTSNKENISYQKLVKIEAELKMKQFMQKFQMDSRLCGQFAQDENLLQEQLEMLHFLEQEGQSVKLGSIR